MPKILPIAQVRTFGKKHYPGMICLDPFMGVSIRSTGEVGLCSCRYWHPTVIGNIQDYTIQDLLNSDIAHRVRQSIRDGTYEYCDQNRCGVIINNRLTPLDQIDRTDGVQGKPSTWDRVMQPEIVDIPRYIYIEGDHICNLSCPSCRTQVINENDTTQQAYSQVMKSLKKNLLNGSDDRPITIYVSSGGDMFASPMIMEFLEDFPLDRYPKVEFNFQTNGLLFQRRWSRIQHLEKNIFNVAITVDSQDPDTYARLRRGGKFSDICKNLEFVAELKKKLGFHFSIRMIVQQDNADEIEKFYEFGQQYGVDDVEYMRIGDWKTYSTNEFQAIDVLDPAHSRSAEIIERFRKLKNQHGKSIVFYHFSI